MQLNLYLRQLLLLLAVLGYTQAFSEDEIEAEYLKAIQLDQAEEQAAGEYNYDQNGDDWGGLCQTGTRQSPIDLIEDYAIARPIPRIRFHNYNQPLRTMYITNNGHTANVVIPRTRSGQEAGISGGLLKGNYTAQSLHFHWGSSDRPGSEHAIDYERFNVEMHIVHKNTRYANTTEASKHPDGLAVLGVFFNATSRQARPQYALTRIFRQLPNIVRYNSNSTISGQITLEQVMGSIVTGEFYTYFGSLTTPGCAEAVTWIVFRDIVQLPERMISKLYNLRDSRNRPLILNYRNIQNTNDRQVFYRGLPNLFN